jgi:molybdopterin synthase sulfur carrier subunit
MAKVFFPDHLTRYTAGIRELDVAASSFRELVTALDARFPGIEAQLMGKVAVAIDGDIVHDPLLEAIEPDSEVYFLHRIEGG